MFSLTEQSPHKKNDESDQRREVCVAQAPWMDPSSNMDKDWKWKKKRTDWDTQMVKKPPKDSCTHVFHLYGAASSHAMQKRYNNLVKVKLCSRLWIMYSSVLTNYKV